MSSPVASPPDVGVVIVAAGAGVRAGPGEPKQFRPIHGVPMLLRTLRPFTSHPAVTQVVVAVPAGFAERPPEWLGKLVGDRLCLVRDSRSEFVDVLGPDRQMEHQKRAITFALVITILVTRLAEGHVSLHVLGKLEPGHGGAPFR